MDPSTGQPADTKKSILDEIAADPSIINRGLAEAVEPLVIAPATEVESADLPAGIGPVLTDRQEARLPVMINLFPPKVSKQPGGRKIWPLVAGVILGLAVIGGAFGYYVWRTRRPAAAPVARITPVATPRSTPRPSPSPSATAVPTPSPEPTQAPLTITAPTTAPTAGHPQTLTVTSQSGLWLRSSPTSVNRTNIIGWMPNGAAVSVDQAGDFWWHGVYKGQGGYFASKYTQ